MAGSPLVSVVVPCHNHARFLGEALESVLAQTYDSFDAVVVDDGSTDDTFRVAERYPVRYVWERNRGVSAARNRGLATSAGEYVVFLDADDRLLPCALAVGVAALGARPDAAFAVGRHRRIDVAGRPLPVLAVPRVAADHYASLLRRCWITVATVTYRRTALEAVGAFDESLRRAEDYELYLRLARRFPVIDHATEVAEYRQHGDMLTADLSRMLDATLSVLRRHRPSRDAPAVERAAYRAREHAVWFYDRLLDAAVDDLAHGRLAAGGLKLLAFVRHLPRHRDYALRRLGAPVRLVARALGGVTGSSTGVTGARQS